jgi:hypothetical protein
MTRSFQIDDQPLADLRQALDTLLSDYLACCLRHGGAAQRFQNDLVCGADLEFRIRRTATGLHLECFGTEPEQVRRLFAIGWQAAPAKRH